MNQNSTVMGLKNLQEPNGSVPKTRVTDALALQDRLRQFINNDSKRAYKRAKLEGLVQGNPPYSPAKLREIGRADACNCNFGTARSYLEQSENIFYDLLAEGPCYFQVYVDGETPDESETWSAILTDVSHELLSQDRRFDFVMQNSIRNMVFHGCGPLFFEDRFGVIPRFAPCGDLKVPDNADSDTSYWEEGAILMNYKVHQLYEKIENEDAARKVGWNVEATKRAIMNAVPERQQQGITLDWEYYQRQFKQNSFASFYDSDIVKCANYYWVEFDGTVTHAIIEQDTQGPQTGVGSDKVAGTDTPPVQFLYLSKSRFEDWSQAIHPFYFDKGYGYHYTVEGLGIKMYGPLVFENRLLCNLSDKSMAPTVIFKPASASSDPFNLVSMNDYAKIPAGWDMQQLTVSGHLEDGLAMRNSISQTLANNLAQYRQTWNKSQGNPPTLGQVKIEQQQQYSVAGTQISRYYKQLDVLYTEMVRRFCQSGSMDKLAKEFQKRCKERGVPPEAFSKVAKVEAARVSGQGSASLRQASLDAIMGMIGRLPEDGQDNLMQDWLASRVGYRNSRRYYTMKRAQKMGNEQEAEAMLQVAAMKIGVPPIVAPSQDAVVFASTFLGVAGQAVGTVQQGGNPVEVVKFLELAVPAGMAHLQRFANDPTREALFKQMSQMVKQLTQVADELKKKVGEQMQKQQAAQGPKLPPDVQQKLMIEDAKGKVKMQNMALSHRQRMQQRQEIHRQQMAEASDKAKMEVARTDLTTAANIRATRMKAFQE